MFDYELRSKDEVRKQLLENNVFDYTIVKCTPDMTMIPIDTIKYGLHMLGEQVKVQFKISEWPMSTCQTDRLKFLLGQRYKNKDKVNFLVRQYPKFEQNYQVSDEICCFELFNVAYD